MIRPLACVALFVIACAAAPSVTSAPQPVAVRWGILDDRVRDYLAREWDAHDHDQPILERAYCLKWVYHWWGGEIAYRVTEIAPAMTRNATTHSIELACAPGPNVAELHTHPPQTCVSETHCWPGGTFAWQCMPSDQDVAWLRHEDHAFGMVMCDRHAVVTYTRDYYRPRG